MASLTLRNTRGIDILVSNADATQSVGIQVKATQGAFDSWLVGKQDDKNIAPNLFFVFVSMNGLGEPAYYVVPQCDVATFVEASHRQWLAGTKRDGSQRKDTQMRKFADTEGRYRNRWDRLGLDAPVP